jgi:hypothetical protein
MPIDPLVVTLTAVVALVVAATVAQRTGEVADRRAGRHLTADAARGGLFGPVLDVLDRSVAADALRSVVGPSPVRREVRVAGGQAAAVALGEELRRAPSGPPTAARPRRIVVSGAPGPYLAAKAAPRRSTVSVELLAAGLGLVVVIGIVAGIWPRERGGVLSATGAPAIATASPTPSPSPSIEAGPS